MLSTELQQFIDLNDECLIIHCNCFQIVLTPISYKSGKYAEIIRSAEQWFDEYYEYTDKTQTISFKTGYIEKTYLNMQECLKENHKTPKELGMKNIVYSSGKLILEFKYLGCNWIKTLKYINILMYNLITLNWFPKMVKGEEPELYKHFKQEWEIKFLMFL